MIAAIFPTGTLRDLSDWSPQLGGAEWKPKIGWHDPDHREATAIKGQRLIEYVRVAAESALPQPVTQDHNRICAWFVFVVGEDAASRSVHSHARKHISRDLRTDEALGLAISSQVETLAAIDADVFERAVLLAPVDEVRIRDRHPFQLRAAFTQDDQALGIGVGKRAKQQGARVRARHTDAEDRRIGSDAKSQSKHGDDREPGILKQHPNSVAQVLQ